MIEKKVRRFMAVLLLLMMVPGLCFGEITEEFATHLFKARKVVGGSVIVSKDGEILYSMTYGFSNARKTAPTTLDTRYRIASVTKLVTAVGLIKLCEEKGISYETPVSDLLGRPVVHPEYPDIPITIRQVLTHTTGIKSNATYTPNWENQARYNNIYDVKIAPGSRYVYANLNGGLMGGMIEALSGVSLNTYMKENIFVPLHTDAAYHAGLLEDVSDVANRLRKNGMIFSAVTKDLANFENYEDFCDPGNHTAYSIGGLYMSVSGLNALMTELCTNARTGESTFLPAGMVSKMMEPQNFEGSSVLVDAEYSLGLSRVTGMTGGTWYGHQGRYDGLTADAFFQPDTGLCVTVIANGYEGKPYGAIVSIATNFMEEAQTYLTK